MIKWFRSLFRCKQQTKKNLTAEQLANIALLQFFSNTEGANQMMDEIGQVSHVTRIPPHQLSGALAYARTKVQAFGCDRDRLVECLQVSHQLSEEQAKKLAEYVFNGK